MELDWVAIMPVWEWEIGLNYSHMRKLLMVGVTKNIQAVRHLICSWWYLMSTYAEPCFLCYSWGKNNLSL